MKGGRKRGRETLASIYCLLHAPNWGPGPQPRHVPWLGIEPANCQFTGQRSMYWATQPCLSFFSLHPRTFCFSLLLERGREREKHRCEREASIGCLLEVPRQGIVPPGPGLAPTAYLRVLTGNWTCDLSVVGQCSSHLSRTGQGPDASWSKVPDYLYQNHLGCLLKMWILGRCDTLKPPVPPAEAGRSVLGSGQQHVSVPWRLALCSVHAWVLSRGHL